jgi:hypothetical protein
MNSEEPDELDILELSVDRPYGAQSARKGSATHASHRSNVCSVISVFIRAGWSLGGVFPRYLKYADHGDQAVAKATLGLDDFSTDWGLLPPEFKPDCLHKIPFGDIVPLYSIMSSNLQVVIRHLLPLVTLHKDWLEQTLDRHDKLFHGEFWKRGFADAQDWIYPPVPFLRSETGMQATGIPLSVRINAKLDAVLERGTPTVGNIMLHTLHCIAYTNRHCIGYCVLHAILCSARNKKEPFLLRAL